MKKYEVYATDSFTKLFATLSKSEQDWIKKIGTVKLLNDDDFSTSRKAKLCQTRQSNLIIIH